MSKIKINEIESLSSNGDLDLIPNGTGVVEIGNDDTDGTLQLNSSASSSKVKIKAPPSTAAQDYTLILPDNQIAQDKYLQVASVTGSGSTAVGQLQYATVATPNVNLDGSAVTTGSLDSARLPTPLSATSGLAFKHVSTYTVQATSGGVHEFDIMGFEEDSVYRLITNKWYNGGNQADRLAVTFYDQSGTWLNWSISTYYDTVAWFDYLGNPSYYSRNNQQSEAQIYSNQYGNNYGQIAFIADITTGSAANPEAAGIHFMAHEPNNYQAYRAYTNVVIRGQQYAKAIGGLKFKNNAGYTFAVGSQMSLYKYLET